MNGLEATALAIFAFESGHLNDPTVPAVRNSNPGNLELPGTNRDAHGKTIFPDFVSGYTALLRELRSKFSGQNAHNIGPSSTVLALFNIYAPPSDGNPTNAYATFVANWVGKALGKPITAVSELANIWMAPSDNHDAVQEAAAE
jgi:hypothetical protein